VVNRIDKITHETRFLKKDVEVALKEIKESLVSPKVRNIAFFGSGHPTLIGFYNELEEICKQNLIWFGHDPKELPFIRGMHFEIPKSLRRNEYQCLKEQVEISELDRNRVRSDQYLYRAFENIMACFSDNNPDAVTCMVLNIESYV